MLHLENLSQHTHISKTNFKDVQMTTNIEQNATYPAII